jgi:hypothetical protein
VGFVLAEASTTASSFAQVKLDDLIKWLGEIRRTLSKTETAFEAQLELTDPTYRKSARNLAHYIALRHRDVRSIQQELAELGLSSLGRAEAHVMATLDAVMGAVRALARRPGQLPPLISTSSKATNCCASIPRRCWDPARPTARSGSW